MTTIINSAEFDLTPNQATNILHRATQLALETVYLRECFPFFNSHIAVCDEEGYQYFAYDLLKNCIIEESSLTPIKRKAAEAARAFIIYEQYIEENNLVDDSQEIDVESVINFVHENLDKEEQDFLQFRWYNTFKNKKR